MWVVPVVLLGIVGAIDDFHSLPVGLRLLLQTGVSLCTAFLLLGWGAPKISLLPLCSPGFSSLSLTPSTSWDGINGISGLVSVTSGAWFVCLGSAEGDSSLAYVGAA